MVRVAPQEGGGTAPSALHAHRATRGAARRVAYARRALRGSARATAASAEERPPPLHEEVDQRPVECRVLQRRETATPRAPLSRQAACAGRPERERAPRGPRRPSQRVRAAEGKASRGGR
eukprot:scaffold38273_cov28-Tisochrysis_lutea.AAC.4